VNARRPCDDPQSVAQPLDRGSCGQDRAFERIGRFAAQAVGDGAQQPILRRHQFLRGVEHQKRARAIGALGVAGGKAGLSDQGRLLIARHAANGHGAPQHPGVGETEIRGRVPDLGKTGHGHIEEFAQGLIPPASANVVQRGAAGVRGVGQMRPAAGEPPDQETVHRPESDVPRSGGIARTRHAIQDPGNLGGRKIRVQQQAGLLREFRPRAAAIEVPAPVGGAAVLPHDGVEQRHAVALVPENRGFALIGDADGGDAGPQLVQSAQHLSGRRKHRGPNHFGVVLHPAGRRVNLLEGLLFGGNRLAGGGERHCPARTGSLINCEQHIIGHRRSPGAAMSRSFVYH
jgi:hypothetical protein